MLSSLVVWLCVSLSTVVVSTGWCGQVKGKPPANPMSNPSGMLDMMKGNMTYMVTHLLMLGWITKFFSGFLLRTWQWSVKVLSGHLMQWGLFIDTLDTLVVVNVIADMTTLAVAAVLCRVW